MLKPENEVARLIERIAALRPPAFGAGPTKGDPQRSIVYRAGYMAARRDAAATVQEWAQTNG